MDEKADIKRFNNIFVTHRDRYIRFAYSYTYNQETAEDLVTESLMYYWENRHRLEEVKDIPLYILVTLKNKCLDYLQRERTWNNIAENLLSNKEWELQMRLKSLTASRTLCGCGLKIIIMSNSTIATNIHQSLNVHLDL